jgi:nuclear transport factor 2 (NTF2) superfamily protein
VRYHKYHRIKEYCEQNENVILVSLEYLQNDDNCIHFLKELNTRYNFNKKEDEFKLVEKHTKNRNIPLKNRTYKINHEDYQSEIDKHKNIEIENEINNLTYFIK